MEGEHQAYWVSFWIMPDMETKLRRIEPEELEADICQIDSIGLSKGNESLMINLIVWAGDLNKPAQITCKMLGTNLDKCFEIMKEILNKIQTVYCSVNN